MLPKYILQKIDQTYCKFSNYCTYYGRNNCKSIGLTRNINNDNGTIDIFVAVEK